MSNECGYLLRKDTEGRPTVFHGEIELLQVSGEFYLIPHAEKRSDRSPDYAFKIRNRSGDFIHYGNAWAKGFKSPRKGGFLSITIDGPGMSRPVTVNAWPDDDQPEGTDKAAPANYTVKWQRPKPKAAAVDGGSDAPLDDEIPY